jgi:hypothetical protein
VQGSKRAEQIRHVVISAYCQTDYAKDEIWLLLPHWVEAGSTR